MRYSKKAINYFRNPKFAGEMKKFDTVGEVGNVNCGDVMRIFLKINDGAIKDIRFLTYGCIGAIASSEAMCKLVKGKKISEALKITHNDIVNELEGMPIVKVHCSVLGREALQKAIRSYKKKNETRY
jgi:nitrogen fixation NifU-like protein